MQEVRELSSEERDARILKGVIHQMHPGVGLTPEVCVESVQAILGSTYEVEATANDAGRIFRLRLTGVDGLRLFHLQEFAEMLETEDFNIVTDMNPDGGRVVILQVVR